MSSCSPCCIVLVSNSRIRLTGMINDAWGEGNLHPRRPPHEYLGEYTSRGKLKIPPTDWILMDPSHKARMNSSDNADLGFQAVGSALCIMQLNVEGLSAAKRHILTHTRRRMTHIWLLQYYFCRSDAIANPVMSVWKLYLLTALI